jgi:hypothetical protein
MEILETYPRALQRDTGVCRRRLVVGALGAVVAAATASFAAQTYSEDAIKAAYLYRFTQYIEWPEVPAAGEPFTIAVLNAPGVAQELRRLLPSHPIKNTEAQVRVITKLQDLGNAQMLYLGPAPADHLRSLIASMAPGSALLVTDNEEGLELGGVLNFVRVDHRVRFEVSLIAADKLKFRISSELLGVAARVRGGSRLSDGSHRQAAGAE